MQAMLRTDSIFAQAPKVSKIEDICNGLWLRPGKKIRAQLVAWFAALYGIPADQVSLYIWAVEAAHAATLMHDDVIDEAEQRRGGPSINGEFGNTLAVLGGDYLISEVVDRLASEGDPRLLTLMCRALKDVCCGEVLQHEVRYTIPQNRGVYRRIATLKTGALFRWAMNVGPTLAGIKNLAEVDALALQLGVFFQICDDWIDLFGGEGKASGNDLREGRLDYVTYGMVRENDSLQSVIEKDFSSREIGTATLLAMQRLSGSSRSIIETRIEILNMAQRISSDSGSLKTNALKPHRKDDRDPGTI